MTLDQALTRSSRAVFAELNAFEVTSFDRCLKRSAADTEQIKSLANCVRSIDETRRHGRLKAPDMTLEIGEGSEELPAIGCSFRALEAAPDRRPSMSRR